MRPPSEKRRWLGYPVAVELARSGQLGTQVGYLRLYLGIGCSGEEGGDGFQSLTWVGKSRRAGDSTGLS